MMTETNGVITSYWVHIGGPGIVTSQPWFQGGTDNDLVMGIPPGGSMRRGSVTAPEVVVLSPGRRCSSCHLHLSLLLTPLV